MAKEGEKTKPKKVKKMKTEGKKVEETPSNEVATASEDYKAGEIAGSLFSSNSSTNVTSLFSLFDTKACAVKPVYVPVVTPKRKLPEADVTKSDKTISTTILDEAKKAKVKKEKELSFAEQNVIEREQALTNADEEETARKKLIKQKKTDKQAKKIDDEDSIVQPKKRIINKAEERIKNKRTVFVGNLPADYNKKMLMSLFKEFGSIESVRFRSVARAEASLSRKLATIHRKVHPKRHNINAYVVFKEVESASKALKRNGAEVGSGFHIRVDLASKGTSHDNKRSAFVGNLPFEIEEETVRQHFNECGNIEAVRIVRDKRTGLGKGFCFVLFEGTDAVQLALKLNNTELLGRKIRVKRCGTSEITPKNTNKNFKEKMHTLKKSKPNEINTFVGETADSTVKKNKNKVIKKKINPNQINKNKGPKNVNKQIGGNKKVKA
ncbi:RNA-binding protein 34 [Discoglossus pictus]